MPTDVIRRISITATQQGVPEATAGLKNLSAAQDGVVSSSEKLTKSQLSVQSAYERQQRSLDISYRMTQQFEKAQRTLDQALQQGIVTVQRHAELSALNADKHNLLTKAANDNTTANGLNQMQLMELGHVAKATFEQIAAGAPALRVLAQQGASTAQAMSLNPGGLAGTLRGLGAAALAFLGPAGLVAAGFVAVMAAAAAFYEYLKTAAPTAEKLLAEHARLLGVIKDSYDSVTGAASKWYQQSQAVTQLQLLQQEIELRQKLQAEIGKTIQSVTTASNLGGTSLFSMFGAKGTNVVREQFAPFEDAIIKLQEGFKQGTPNVREFADEIANIALLSPALQKIGNDLINSVGDASKLDYALKQIADAKKLISGAGLGADERGRLGLPDAPKTGGQADPFQAQINSISKHTATLQADTAAVGASVGEHARLRAEAQLLEVATRNGAAASEEQKQRIKEVSDAAGAAAQALGQKAAEDQVNFERQTMFLSDTEKQIAQVNKQLHGDDWKAWGDSALSNQMRINAGLKDVRDSALDFSKSFVSGLMQGKNGMQALTAAAEQLASKMADKALTDLFSGNFLQAGVEAVVAIGAQLFANDQKGQQKLKDAQEEWKKAGPAFQKFLTEMSGGVQGNLAGKIQDAAQREADFELQAWKARDSAAIFVARSALANFTDTQKRLFQSTFAALVVGFEQGMGQDSPFLRAVNSTGSALNAALAFIDDANTAIGAGGSVGGVAFERARTSSQAYLLSLLNTAPALTTVQTEMARINGTATALQGALVQLGQSSEQAADAIRSGVTAAVNNLRDQFAAGLTERLNAANGVSFLNDATALLVKHRQDLADASALGNDPALMALIGQVFHAEAQKIVNDAGLVGDAFADFTRQFPELASVVTESSDALVAANKQIQDSINSTASSIVDFVRGLQSGASSPLSPGDQLFAAQAAYNAKLALAQTGNISAQSSITSDAQHYIDAARAVFASSAGFQNIFTSISAQLLALPAVQATTDPVVQATRDVVTAINNAAITQAKEATLQAAAAAQAKDSSLGILAKDATVSGTGTASYVQLAAMKISNDNINAQSAATAANTNTAASLIGTSNALTTTANQLATAIYNMSNYNYMTLQSINQLTAYSLNQLTLLQNALNPAGVSVQITGSVAGGSGTTTTIVLQNQMVAALNKIVWNTYVISQNTAYQTNGNLAHGHAGIGTYAAGGVIPPFGLGLVSEHLNPRFIRAGSEPITVTPFSPSNDNSAMVSELRAVKAELVRLQKIVAASSENGARAIVGAVGDVADGVDKGTKRTVEALSMKRRDQRAVG